MKKLFVGLMSAAALFAMQSGQAEAGSNKYYSYAVKFLCGKADKSEYRLVDGVYATAINVFNPHDKYSQYEWNVWFAYGSHPGGSYGYAGGKLDKYNGFAIDCKDLYYDWSFGEEYVKGIVYIWSEKPLDVIAVYSTGSRDGAESVDVEHVPGRRINEDERTFY